MIKFLTLIFLLFSFTAFAQTVTNKDPNGRITSRCSVSGNEWVCKTPEGRIISRSQYEDNRNNPYYSNPSQNYNQNYQQEEKLPFQYDYNTLSKMLKFDSQGNLIGHVMRHRNGQWHLFDIQGKLIAKDSSP